ncbi:C2 domain-containing protein 3 isoform X2 [Varanus komodoensis]|uniref:C2 domain-containing protein 3 isoform X2 n=1 Tax=Varanus komodoensis TaxID=61221 RepID=UPI001CF7864F|nr:C2 domain-containing protein 3 isoform X2 [Varanus komodoensis]
MKQKKPKGGPARPGPSRRRRGLSDISPSTSLPPLVEGQLRCFLKMTVNKILWTIAKPPASVLIRVRWWGETSDGTVFVPRDTSQAEQKALKTTTRYPIRCGPKQFASYLTDMGTLILEVMTKSDHLPIGRTQLSGLAQLSPSHPLSGFFTIVSPTSEKMGELQVSLVLEPLSETFGSSNSIPNADVSFSAGLSAQGAKEVAKSGQHIAPSPLHQPPGTSVIGGESWNGSRASTPRGKDHLYFQENSENIREGFFGPQQHLILGQNDPLKASAPKQQEWFPRNSDDEAQVKSAGGSPRPVRVLSCNAPATKDLLSALLDQGHRLREAMVVSAMKSSLDLNAAHPPAEQDIGKLARKNLKNLTTGLVSTAEEPLQPQDDCSQFDLHSEDRAIQLLLGSADFSPVRHVDGTGSPPESVSLGSEVYDSELNDPHYDQSLLENLFYTARKSDSSLSDFLSEEEDGVPSGKLNRSQYSKLQKSPKALESSSLDQKGKGVETKFSSSLARPLPLHETSMESAGENQAVNLSLDRLTVLGRIRLARAVVENLKIPPEDPTPSTPGKKSCTGKPPRPALPKKRTYFVEYHFPVAASKTGTGQVAITTETVRVASSKTAGEVVKFQQRYVFPIHFGGLMITHWWDSDLEFNIYVKKGAQRKPLLVGSGALPLRDVIQSEQLMVSCALPVKEDGAPARLGPLKVSLELAADNKDFSSINARAGNLAQQAPVYTARSPGVTLPAADRRTAPAESPWLPKEGNCPSSKRSQESLPADPGQLRVDIGQPHVPTPASRNLLNQLSACEEEGLLLHVLLMVPEGQVSVPRDAGRHGSCNLYLNCKLFSTEEATRSAVVWGTTQPKFHFSQVTPISLTPKHLERLKNNVMVIEAWNKVHSPRGDRLLGLVKLPLHQFYVSFKDPKISGLLLQAQYPVLAVDGSVPVVDVFTGNQSGSLKVILAMGSADQIVALQRLKNEEGVVPPVVLRPPHSLDSLAAPLPKPADREREGLMEHIFEIRIESVKGLTPLQSTVWGEADCYVQYHFPVQKLESDMLHGNALHERGLELQPFRSATTLCVPDPAFDDVRLHSLSLPADAPVQRLLLSAFSAQGLAGGGGVQFEIWCRYYYPNVREQMVARGTLPLSRLCAMVTMRHREEVGLQTFSLPLIPRTEGSGELQPRSSGLLDVSIKYRRSPKVTKGVLAAQVVSISVQIHSAAGLQAAARALVENNPSLQYSAEVGVNAYVSVQVPFLPKAERRLTRAVARTFCPEFEHHTEFPCNLMVQRSSGETCCLGELLQLSEIVFSIFHKNLSAAPYATKTPRDELLGTARVPTRDLLTKRSGIRGWYPVTLPEDLVSSRCENVLQTVVGGLEVSVTFAHSEDRERVLDAAKLLGWNWEESCTEGLQDDDEDGGQPARKLAVVTVSIPCLWLPLKCVLLAGQTHLNKRVYCYLRYKLYDQEATWTSLRRPKLAEDQNHVTVTFKKSKQMDLPWSQMLLWYFREERLEVQVWRAYGNEGSTERPLETDRLIGSAYVDLAGLGGSSRRKQTVSGVFPLFRRNAANLLGAAARVHITVASSSPHAPELAEDGSSGGGSGDSSECEMREEGPEQDLERPLEPHPPVAEILHERSPEVPPPPEDPGKTFAVSILVERAMHLSLKGSPLTERGVMSPSSYVSFVTADADLPVTTEVVENTDSPVWDFQQQTRLSKELLLDPQQTLVFKVWHKADVERVIGFASVDLSPLLSGFQVVCGWYNITDFSGQCQGQIKVAVSPLESILHLKEERQARSRTKAPGSAIPASSPFALHVAFPAFATRSSEMLFPSSLKGADAAGHAGTGSSRPWMPRHEEHVQNIRQFHESLQQAEGTTSQVGRLDSLSHSSRNSLLRTLRKNLSELDEIQRYFHQKLTKPYPDVGPSGRNLDDPGARTVDPTGRHLLAKSNHLVSQVSSLLVDLQNNMRNAEESASARGDGRRSLSASDSLRGVLDQSKGPAGSKVSQAEPRKEPARACVDQGPLCPLVNSPCGRGEPYEFLGQGDSPSGPPSPTHCHQQAEDTAESHSEGEYDEDIIEPRTLNEITVVTDKTSPWSSVLSEPEGDQEAEVARGTEPPEGSLEEGSARSSPLPSVPQEGPRSTAGTARPRNVPSKEGSDPCVGSQHPDDDSGELLQPAAISAADQPKDGPGEGQSPDLEGALEMQSKWGDGRPLRPGHGGGGSATPEAVAPETEEGRGASLGTSQAEEETSSRGERHQPCPEFLDAAQQNGSCPDESHRDPPAESDELSKPSVALSDPVVVPNFFLPPQHLEASMRMLSVSSASLATGRVGTGRDAAATGIPCRRENCDKRRLTPAQLPEEEMKRIAKIFSTQFSKKP